MGKDITKKHVYKKVRKVGDVKEVIYPVPINASEDATAAEKSEEKFEEGTGMSFVITTLFIIAASRTNRVLQPFFFDSSYYL